MGDGGVPYTKHIHRLLNPLTKTEMTSDNLQESSMVGY
jgi:hypothetical protein